MSDLGCGQGSSNSKVRSFPLLQVNFHGGMVEGKWCGVFPTKHSLTQFTSQNLSPFIAMFASRDWHKCSKMGERTSRPGGAKSENRDQKSLCEGRRTSQILVIVCACVCACVHADIVIYFSSYLINFLMLFLYSGFFHLITDPWWVKTLLMVFLGSFDRAKRLLTVLCMRQKHISYYCLIYIKTLLVMQSNQLCKNW